MSIHRWIIHKGILSGPQKEGNPLPFEWTFWFTQKTLSTNFVLCAPHKSPWGSQGSNHCLQATGQDPRSMADLGGTERRTFDSFLLMKSGSIDMHICEGLLCLLTDVSCKVWHFQRKQGQRALICKEKKLAEDRGPRTAAGLPFMRRSGLMGETAQELHLNEMTNEQGIEWKSPGSFGNFVFKNRNQWLSTVVTSASLEKKTTSVHTEGIKSNRKQSLNERTALWERQH